MTEQLLHRADVVAALDQRRREAVSKYVGRHALRDPRPHCRVAHVALDRRLEQMMPPDPPRARTRRQPIRRKHPLPARLEPRPRILPRQRIRQLDLAEIFRQIPRMQPPRRGDLLPQRLHRPIRHHRQAIPPPLPIPNPQLPPFEIHVLNPQPQSLQEPQPASPKQKRHRPRIPLHSLENALHLLDRQHHRNPNRPPRPHHPRQRPQIAPDHIAIEEEQSVQRLILRPRRYVPPRRQMAQEQLHLRPPHLRRMPLPMKQNELPHPGHITPLRRQRPMPHPKLLPQRLEHPRRPRPQERRPRPQPQLLGRSTRIPRTASTGRRTLVLPPLARCIRLIPFPESVPSSAPIPSVTSRPRKPRSLPGSRRVPAPTPPRATLSSSLPSRVRHASKRPRTKTTRRLENRRSRPVSRGSPTSNSNIHPYRPLRQSRDISRQSRDNYLCVTRRTGMDLRPG